jgi:hypothetical protein
MDGPDRQSSVGGSCLLSHLGLLPCSDELARLIVLKDEETGVDRR